MKNLKDVILGQDEIIFGFRRGDMVTVATDERPATNSLIIVQNDIGSHIRRFLFLDGEYKAWPPTDGKILGQAVSLSRNLIEH